MNERSDLLSAISKTVADYRKGDLATLTPDHVDQWVAQFSAAVQVPVLREINHVLRQTYFSQRRTRKFMGGLFKTEKLVGDDPCAFWKGVKFLDIQGGGASQREMLALFSKILEKKCGCEIGDCGADPNAFVYLDDAMFTGNRVRQDLEVWIGEDAPLEANVHVVSMAIHEGGKYYAKSKLERSAQKAGKMIQFTWWRAIQLEDRKAYTDSSDVLRPVSIPNDDAVRAYVADMQHRPHLRKSGSAGQRGIFSSDEGRQLLEQEFLRAGVRIRQMCPNLNNYQRPLGNMVLETLGFGSLIVTFRNCPNNAPLALWVDDPWYPLFPRKTNSIQALNQLMAP